jgi:ADP-heptose:LPS heptosyltransferase
VGFGDEIMATYYAKIEKKKYPDRQVVVGNYKTRQALDSRVFFNNPNISDPKKLDKNKIVHFVDLNNTNRPYIDWERTTMHKYYWNLNHRTMPGELYFDEQEINEAQNAIREAVEFWKSSNSIEYKGIIFVESSRVEEKSSKHDKKIFNKCGKNQNWSHKKWGKTVEILKKNYLIINPTHQNSFTYQNTFSYGCNFRVACAIMKYCNLYLGPEGGFAHAAAALSKPGVVIYGGWIPPQIIGYDFHENLYVDIEGSPCGIRDRECDHCKKCMDLITVDNVINAVERNINKKVNY